eukprot:1154533-Pelagomonas_calceolata.AAC.1
MMLWWQPLILGSPRARALSVDPPTQSPPLSTGIQAHSGRAEQLGGGEKPTPLTPGTPGCGRRANSSCQLKEDIQAAYQSDPLFSRRKYTRGLERRDGIWYYKGRVVVPNSSLLKRRILELCHDSTLSGHVGTTKTYHLVSRDFYWNEV